MRREGQPSNYIFRLLSKHGVSPCLGTLHECQMKRAKKDINSCPWRSVEDHWDALILCWWRL